jgi:hypothetical protein
MCNVLVHLVECSTKLNRVFEPLISLTLISTSSIGVAHQKSQRSDPPDYYDCVSRSLMLRELCCKRFAGSGLKRY